MTVTHPLIFISRTKNLPNHKLSNLTRMFRWTSTHATKNDFDENFKRYAQSEIIRQSLAEIPWTDKPRWLRQTVLIMLTRANIDLEMRPYGIFVLNYTSYKDIMKFIFSVGNVYSRTLASK